MARGRRRMHKGGFSTWGWGGGEGRCTREGLLNGVGGGR